ncbi:MAG: 1-deoxy-D-xylulose-5-phosphate reductoisomerase, partial [Candidatus Ruthia sp.]|nr:1-deoxy-D-xylulose-5-phosphate reductoisomerase [Candidatus Ruthturnera sp.]MBT4123293.1 1-deoxy-D-xylulose-5-phosphate reductoisomerase [Candidatus Ruthturnera sp.]
NPPLEFYKPDLEKFACLRLAFEALKQGGNAMGTINAANEVAVEAFLNQAIGFLDIPHVIEQTLTQVQHAVLNSLDDIIANDQEARNLASKIVGKYA